MPPAIIEKEESEFDSEEDQLDEDDYTLSNVLRPSRPVSYSIEKLYALMHCGDLDLEPEYQRGFVWPESKQIAIIDSILRNYYIPPVIFHVISDSTGEEKRVAIDGKQRLTSIQRFIDGIIPHKDTTTGKKYYSSKAAQVYPGRNLNILPDNLEKRFYMKQIVCVEYDGLTETQEREVFNRVQMGVPLSTAERLAAVSGHRSQTVHMLEGLMANWPEKIKLANDRKRRFILLGHIVRGVATLDASPPKITVPSNPALEKWLREPGDVRNVDSLKEDLEILIRIATDFPNTAFPASIAIILAPVEFIYATILVHRFRRQLTLEQLALAIRDMRMTARQEHPDIRMNAKVSKSLDKFVMDDMPIKLSNGEFGYQTTGPASTKRKRTIQVEDYEGDSDYVETTARMEISDDDRPRATRKKRTTEPMPARIPAKGSAGGGTRRSPLFSPNPADSNSSRAGSSVRGNPLSNASPIRGVGPFGRH